MQRTINLPKSIDVTRYGATCAVDTASLPDAIIEALVIMAINNKVGDSAANVARELAAEAAGASWAGKTKAEQSAETKAFALDPTNADALKTSADSAMTQSREGLFAGLWKTRVASDAVDTFLAKAVIAALDMTFDKGVATADKYRAAMERFATFNDETQTALVAQAKADKEEADAEAARQLAVAAERAAKLKGLDFTARK